MHLLLVDLRADLIKTLSSWGYSTRHLTQREEALRFLAQPKAPRLVLVRSEEAGWALDFCERVRHLSGHPYAYLVVATRGETRKGRLEAMLAGADDMVDEPVDLEELKVRLHVGSRIMQAQAGLIEARDRFQQQSLRDPLTGLYNRTAVLEALERELNRARREGAPVGLVMADIDHFKSINDTWGHLAGDAVLMEVGNRMRNSVRAYDSVGRYGGEEFLLVFPGCDYGRAAMLAERIRVKVGGPPVLTEHHRFEISLSLGVSSAQEGSRPDAQALIQVADEALYRAKAAGRNQVGSPS